jgi:hypothetical protein
MMILGMPVPFPTNITPAANTVSDWWVLLGIAVAFVLVAVVLSIALVTGRTRKERPAHQETHEVHEAPRRAA